LAPSTGSEAATEFVRAYVAVHQPALLADLPKFNELLSAASYIVRARISTPGNWAFARFRTILTAAIPDGAEEQVPVVLLPNKAVGELVVVQLTPTADKGKVFYTDPGNFEELTAEDATSPSNDRTKLYTIYNGNELWFWPVAEAGATYRIAGRLDLMDSSNELPMNFAAFISSVYLYFIGAAPPKDRTSWLDEAMQSLKELQDIDRPAERGGGQLNIPIEEGRHSLANS
jgi:hypothetical protein